MKSLGYLAIYLAIDSIATTGMLPIEILKIGRLYL